MTVGTQNHMMNFDLSTGSSSKAEVFQLICKLEREEGYFVIESEILGIAGAGKTIAEAEKSFSEGIGYIFKRYNQLPENKLSGRVKRIKDILNSIVIEGGTTNISKSDKGKPKNENQHISE